LQGFRSGREIHADLEPGSAELPGLQTRCWFAVYTTCRHEKKVSLYLRHRAIEHYLPLYQSERKWKDGSRVTLELPLFPGYMFVHIAQSERTGVLGVPGAVALVDGTGGAPAPIGPNRANLRWLFRGHGRRGGAKAKWPACGFDARPDCPKPRSRGE
jgi:transcription antitermination factor NusG